jgi:tetratricopeptide (TPR) repeat protein
MAEKNFTNWRQVRKQLLQSLEAEPKNHWILTRLGNTYFQEGDNRLALAYVIKALRLQPECPLALWDYACVLDDLGKSRQAFEIFSRLVRKGVGRIRTDDCGEGIRWAKSLVNDSRYRAGFSAHSLKLAKSAKAYFVEHFKNRERGVFSLYKRPYARRKVLILYPELKGKI